MLKTAHLQADQLFEMSLRGNGGSGSSPSVRHARKIQDAARWILPVTGALAATFWLGCAHTSLHHFLALSPLAGLLGLAAWMPDRKAAPEEMNQLLVGMWQNSVDGLRLTDSEGRIVQVNDAFCQLVGIAREDLIGASMDVIHAPAVRDHVLAQYRQRVQTDHTIPRTEQQIELWNGKTLWLDVSHTVATVGSGARYLISGFRDITRLKRLQQELIESEERLRSNRDELLCYFDMSTVGMCVNSRDQRFVRVNRTLESMVGYTAEELSRLTWADLTHPDDLTLATEHFERALRGAVDHYELEKRYLHKDGSVVHVHLWVTCLRDANGEPGHFLASMVDISQQKKAERALQEAEKKYRALVENSQGIIYTVQPDGTLSFASPSWTRHLGHSLDEVLGHSFREFIHPEDLPECRAFHQRALETRRADGELVYRVIHKDGSQRWHRSVMAPVLAEDGSVAALVGNATDVTNQIEVESALRRANLELAGQTRRAREMAARAETASRIKSDFLATMSHELRTPMSGVLGMLGLALDDEMSESQREKVEVAYRSAESLLHLVNDVLDLAKIESDRFDLETSDFDLSLVVDEVAGLFASQARAKGIQFRCVIDPGVPTRLRGDPDRLRQIFVNLIGNAIKFTDAGGVAVGVSGQSDQPGEIRLQCSVRDTGPGISAEAQPLLFHKFVQGDSGLSRRHGGTGLGLAISRQLCEKMGGNIGVRSQQGVGAEFVFEVRLQVQPPPDHLDARHERVLLLTRDDAQIRALQDSAQQIGLAVTVASNPAQTSLLRADIRAILCDTDLPGIEDLLPALRDAHGTGLPVFWMGALGALRESGTPAFDGRLPKPVSAITLLQRARMAADDGRQSGNGSTSHRNGASVQHRILIAEDNPVNQRVLVSILKAAGYRTDVAGNGLEAIAAVQRYPYDLVLMDVQMPDMDGLEATRRLRSDPDSSCASLPIIAVTAHAMKGDRERFLAAGMTDYLAKPIEREQLFAVLHRWIGTRHPDAVPVR